MCDSDFDLLELPEEMLEEVAGGNGCGIDPNGG